MSSGLRELKVPEHWHTLDFISDIHLEVQSPQTHAAWAAYLATTPADAVFILGDLFEVWVGDDLLKEPQAQFSTQCVQALRDAGRRLSLFFMHGNRDFLIGADFLAQCQATLLDDPCVLRTAEQCWLLSHGDAWCLDDAPYLAFRKQVRSPAWQAQFLSQPLAQRQAMARQMREHSQRQQAERWQAGAGYVDVDQDAAKQALERAGASTLIHGHTHRPARHEMGEGLAREVLSDWDAQETPPRAQVLRLSLPAGLAPRLERVTLL